MYRILLLFFALLLASNVESVAARPTAYARAKMKGRSYTHRPFYKKYKGRKSSKKRGFFSRKGASSKSTYRVGHSTR
ncbi:hypothetical protein [Hymenobacter wooponensis]|uniref:Uncharacterized protein n=1 Tax=Hymenobacter wooponensis TaxID=1525360 RepID=A0A4Z0MHQ7_9BACT|nr:hypothetical protein [Hymenobacter wooponensis]TGD79342.1 hypothetical protein EU557_13980 [Hymenobacter wooponensis]